MSMPRREKRQSPERKACLKLYSEFCRQYPKWIPLFYHIDNGGKMTPEAGRLRKALGVRSGVPDYFLARVLLDSSPHRNMLYAGLYLEMKALGGMLSDEQKDFIKAARQQHYCVVVAWGFHEGMAAIDAYMRADMPALELMQQADTRKDRRAAGRPVGMVP